MTLEALQDRIREAAARKAPLRLRGGGSKDFYGNEPRGELLDTRSHAGIVSYEPTELVVTARCGTALTELEILLKENRQCLPFEPPHFGVIKILGARSAKKHKRHLVWNSVREDRKAGGTRNHARGVPRHRDRRRHPGRCGPRATNVRRSRVR